MKRLIIILPIVLLLGIIVGVAVFTKQQLYSKLTIIAGENFWGNIASQIAGNNAQIISIISDPNQDPHAYDSTARDARNISNASIVIENGAGYDTFMDKLLATTSGKTVINVADISHIQTGDNPHMWYNLNIVQNIASVIASDLERQDPAHKEIYASNYNDFILSLQSISTVCNQIKQRYNGTNVIATERVFDYILTNCGMHLIKNDFQKSVEEGIDPSIDSVSSFENVLQSHQAKVLIYNTQTVSAITQKEQNLAKENGIPVVGVTETMPHGFIYQTWMLEELHSLLHALQNNG